MVLHAPFVQLEHQPSRIYESLVLGSAVRALATEQALIPPTTGFDVTDADQGLQVHACFRANDQADPQPGQRAQETKGT